MSEKEKRIMEALARAVKGAPENRKDYLLGWAEGAASLSDTRQAEAPQRPPA